MEGARRIFSESNLKSNSFSLEEIMNEFLEDFIKHPPVDPPQKSQKLIGLSETLEEFLQASFDTF